MSTSIVVDLGFGDAGKGTLVDALARRCSSPPLVVRHNGGAQAGHNVHTADGRHHTFSQFGAATFVPGSRTLLSQHMVFHPTALIAENDHLVSVGVNNALERLMIDERALVITPYHQAVNRLREIARGAARHGTCGAGVGETVADSLEHGDFAIRVKDLDNANVLRRKLYALRDHKLQQIQPFVATIAKSNADLAVLEDPGSIERTLDLYVQTRQRLCVVDAGDADWQIRNSKHVIFEGAQGVLLDEWHGFHPHTTWSTTTTQNADALIAHAKREGPVRRIGVTRAYATRHGQGPFPTENHLLTQQLRDAHNTDTGWQGRFRVGWFDAVLTRYALSLCPGITEIAVTCLDRLALVQDWSICEAYMVPTTCRERFVYEDGRAINLRGRPAGDLAYQEQLTADLAKCAPVLYRVPRTPFNYAHAIEQRLRVPVNIMSLGQTANDKRWYSTTGGWS